MPRPRKRPDPHYLFIGLHYPRDGEDFYPPYAEPKGTPVPPYSINQQMILDGHPSPLSPAQITAALYGRTTQISLACLVIFADLCSKWTGKKVRTHELIFSAEELEQAKEKSGLYLEPKAPRLSYAHPAALEELKSIVASNKDGWTEELKFVAQEILDGGHHKAATAFLRDFNYHIDRKSQRYKVKPSDRLAKIKYYEGRQTNWLRPANLTEKREFPSAKEDDSTQLDELEGEE